MKKLILAILLISPFARATSAPILFFSDLDSGPKTGGENNKGVYVCVWGEGFGGSRGSSTITVGGGAVDNYPVWGAAWRWYQKSCFQLGASVSSGNIVMHTGGGDSNGLSFTVRSGNIYFVDIASGNNANPGTVGSPWKDAWWAKNHIAPGDTAYLRAGTWSTIEPVCGFCTPDTGFGDGVSLLHMVAISGTSGNPMAIVGYPGETAILACDKSTAECIDIRNNDTGAMSYWTWADLTISGTYGTHYIIDQESTFGGDGNRWIGNEICCGTSVIMVQQGSMNGLNILGNYFHLTWDVQHGANRSERGYAVYFGGYGTQQNINVKWNSFYQDEGDCQGRVSTASSGHTVTWNSGCNFAGLTAGTFPSGSRVVVGTVDGQDDGLNYQVVTKADSTHITVDADPGNHSDVLYVSGGNGGTKGIDIYGHLSGDIVKSWSLSDNEFYNYCREGILAGGSDGGTPIIPDTGTQLISNNLFIHNGPCDVNFGYSAITLQSGVMSVLNNSFYHNGNSPQGAPSCDIDNQSVTAMTVSNNAFVAPASPVNYTSYICVEGGGSTTQISGNTNSFIGDGNGGSYLTGNINATDPSFVSPGTDPSTADFHLQSGSAVKTGGTALTLASPDKDGCTRPQGATYGLGPYEFPVTCSTPAPPPPPTVMYFPAVTH